MNGSAAATINGSSTSTALEYQIGAATGTYQLSLQAVDQANRTTTTSRTLNVARGVFLKDPRDARPRSIHTATVLNDGRVLVVGGDAGIPAPGGSAGSVQAVGSQSLPLGTAEIFDPATRTWASAGTIPPRFGHSATLLEDGRVLVAGGVTGPVIVTPSVQLFDPAAQAWTAAAPLGTARAFHSATLLADGRVLVAAGADDGGALLSSAEIYNPTANAWTPAAATLAARVHHSATRLRDGRVLVATGAYAGGPNAEIYDPSANQWQATGNLPVVGSRYGAVLLPSGKVFHLANEFARLYDPATNTWTTANYP